MGSPLKGTLGYYNGVPLWGTFMGSVKGPCRGSFKGPTRFYYRVPLRVL